MKKAAVLAAVFVAAVGASSATAATFTVTNTNDSGAGSLRRAIQNANGTAAADVVAFNIPGAGVHSIGLTSALPAITRPLTIDGTTEPSFAGSPVVELNGFFAGATTSGLRIMPSANSSSVRGLIVNRFNRDGIALFSDGNLVAGNIVGMNATGTVALSNGRNGVAIYAGSANNMIGGATSAARNVLSGNNRSGVLITGGGATGNRVRGNYIGIDEPGSSADGNLYGVWVSKGASANDIGGTQGAHRNVISGNAFVGVLISGSTSHDNRVRANRIGTNAAGSAAVANGTGVMIGAGGHHNRVGDTGASANVISGNLHEGVFLDGVRSNIVEGNRIGLNAAGATAVPNAESGVRVGNAAKKNTLRQNTISGNTINGVLIEHESTSANKVRNNRIGTNPAGTSDLGNDVGVLIRFGASANDVFGNVISGNDIRGVDLADSGTWNNVVRGNMIGTNAAGTAALANPNGIFIHNGASKNRIGGTTAAERNVISGNTSRGVEVSINAPTGNLIRGNYIGLNAAGTGAVPNNVGVILLAGATDTTIGGTEPGTRNVISGNASHGVFVGDSTTVGTIIQGNRVGTNAAGTGAVANGDNGVHLAQSAQDVLVGGSGAAARNVVSGNENNGVCIVGSATALRVVNNFIGTNASGGGAVPNAIHGVAVGGLAHDNEIRANRIAQNGGAGILIGSDAAQAAVGLGTDADVGNAALANRIYANGGIGIDLGPFDGLTANDLNDPDAGPNGLQNFPVLSTAITAGSTFVTGSLNSLSNRSYRLEFYADTVASGEGRKFLGARTVAISSGSNDVSFSFVFPEVSPGSIIRATATSLLQSSTSELGSAEIVVARPIP